MKRFAILGACCVLVAALAGGALMLPLKEHLRALMFIGTALPEPGGPHVVGTTELALAADPAAGTSATFPLRLWYPAEGRKPRRNWLSAPTEPPALRDAAVLAGPLPLIVYAPSWNAGRNDNSFRAANLASHGYVVAAMDDIVHDPAGVTGAEGPDRAATLDFASATSYAATRPLADARAAREARKASVVLDRLAGDAAWRTRLDFAKIGFLGFSFGGAAASEAPWLEPRIKAVVNLDGWVFGEAARRGVKGPYLTLWSDFPVPFDVAGSPQAEIDLMNDYIGFEARQMARPDKFGFMIAGLNHLDYCDRLVWPAFEEFREPRALDRPAMHGIIDAYILDFFGAYLLGRQPKLITLPQPPYPGVRSISSIAASQAGTASAPAKPD
jgi:dienelactone hydrolase